MKAFARYLNGLFQLAFPGPCQQNKPAERKNDIEIGDQGKNLGTVGTTREPTEVINLQHQC